MQKGEKVSTYQIHVFISHSWKYSNHYDKLAEWIFSNSWRFGQASVDFRNFSVPQNDPIHNARTDAELQAAIYNKIVKSHVVVIPTAMYTSYSKWIKKELEGAQQYKKPILAVNPWGQQHSADVVTLNADECVGWNSQSVIDGIWKLFRN